MQDVSFLSDIDNSNGVTLKKLNEEQIDLAIQMVKQHHPLNDTLLWITLPYLQPVKNLIPGWVPRTTEPASNDLEQSESSSEDDEEQKMEAGLNSSSNGDKPIQEYQPLQNSEASPKQTTIERPFQISDKFNGPVHRRQTDIYQKNNPRARLTIASNQTRHSGILKSKTKLLTKQYREEEEFQLHRQISLSIQEDHFRPAMSHEDRQATQNELVKKAVKQDPFLRYGVAVHSFFDLHSKLMWLFAFLSLFAVIQMIVYFAFGGLSYLNYDYMYLNSRLSFGNMGFSGVVCGKNVISWEDDKTPLYFQCQKSTVITGIRSSGLITPARNITASKQNLMTICYQTQHEQRLDPDQEFFQKDSFDSLVLGQCMGQTYCNLDVPNDLLRQGNYTQLQYVFAQLSCEITSDMLSKKNNWGLLISCIGLFMCLTLRFTIDYIRNRNAINDKFYDMGLISAEKYTVVGRISDSMYENFKQSAAEEGQSKAKLLAKRISNEIERTLKNIGVDEGQVKIADLAFAFNNAEMLRLLTHRAKALLAAKFKSVVQIEEKMTREKNLLYDKVVQPNSFYCTFQHAPTKIEAEKQEYFEILGEPCQVKAALEPTNIIWENRSVSKTHRLIRISVVLIVMAAITLGFFTLGSTSIYYMITMKYWENPPGVNCDTVIKNYGENLPTLAHQEIQIILSVWDKYSNTLYDSQKSGLNQITSRQGWSTCFCRDQIQNKRMPLDELYDVWTPEGIKKVAVCQEDYTFITSFFGWGKFFYYLYSIQIVIWNLLSRILFMKLIKLVRFASISAETQMTMTSLLLVYFLNYGMMYVICPSTFAVVSFGFKYVYGVFPDINAFWFNDIGYMVSSSMLIEAVFPVIEFFLYWVLRWVKLVIDQRRLCCPNNPYKTHQKTIAGFEELYSGPEFEIHYKYAYIIDVVYLACIFGPSMPIFFPIAFFAILLQYSVERLMVAYWYRRPPIYDSRLNSSALYLLALAPLIYCFSAAWTFSNQQVFRNQVLSDKTSDLFPPVEHHIWQFFYQMTPGTPFILLAAVLLCLEALTWISYYSKKGRFTVNLKGKFQGFNFAPFYQTLRQSNLETWVQEEENTQKITGSKRMQDSHFDQLVASYNTSTDTMPKFEGKMFGVYNYDILSNPDYARKFYYIPSGLYGKREQYTISQYKHQTMRDLSMDLVRSVSDLAYYEEDAGKELQFSQEYLHSGSKRPPGKRGCCHSFVPETLKIRAIWILILSLGVPGLSTIWSAFCDTRVNYRALTLGLVIQVYKYSVEVGWLWQVTDAATQDQQVRQISESCLWILYFVLWIWGIVHACITLSRSY